MPRLHHRMRSHRGTPRRAPSNPSSTSPSLPSELTAGHYPRTRSGRGRFHLPSHYPPDSTSSPSFSSTIFTFNCTLNRPRITTHISVFFHEEAQAVGESSSQQEGHASVSAQNPFSLQVPEIPIHNALDVVMETAAPGSSKTAAPRARDETEAARARELPEFGWCRIVEEPPDV